MDFLELTLFDSINKLIIISIIIFISQFIYSSVGFGSGMFAISLLALLYKDISLFVPFFLLLCIPTEIIISFKDRAKIDYKHNWRFLLFIFPAIILGAFVLNSQHNIILTIMLGSLIMILSIYYLFFEKKINLHFNNKSWFLIVGSMSGFLGGLFGMSGPPLIFYFKSIKLNKQEFRVALISIFFAMSLFRIIVYMILKIYTQEMLLSSLLLLPFAFSGLFLGMFFHNKIQENIFKRFTSIILFICGLLIVLKNSLLVS